MKIWDELRADLDARAADSLRRELRRVPENALDLASNDYLGLAHDARVIEAAQDAAAQFGTGARASRLVSGHYDLIQQLELELARFKNCEAALVFSSGYAANLGVITALANENSALFCHKRNHASLFDACELAQTRGKAKARFWQSNEKLRSLLASSHAARKLIICDGVFSMDGDLCDLPAIVDLAEEFDALILLDDAHGTGTLGETGRGTAEHYGIAAELAPPFKRAPGDYFDCKEAQAPLPHRRIITLGTLSKSLGSQGGFVCGPRVLIDYLVGAARSFVYSTGLNPPAAGAALAALRIIEAEPNLVRRCRENAEFLAREIGALGYDVTPQSSPITPVYAGDSAAALQLSEQLLQKNLWCRAIRPPTVKRARLRLTSRASWSDDDLARIVAGFAGVKASHGIPS